MQPARTYVTSVKDETVRQWTADPCGPLITAPPGTWEAITQLLAGRRAYAPWVDETFAYEASAGLDVLDVGCGQGIDLVEHASRGARATGVDLTPRHVDLARRHVRAMGLTATVLHGDAESLPFADASFDRVTSNGVLHHTPDMPAALREIRRVLRPGGQVIVTVYNRHSLHYLLYQFLFKGLICGELLKKGSMKGVLSDGVERTSVDARPLIRVYSSRQLRRMLYDAGFTCVQTSIRGFALGDIPFGTRLARRVPLLDSRAARERIGRIGGWYVVGAARRG